MADEDFPIWIEDMDADCNPNKNCSLCTGDATNNVWSVPRAPGYPNRCVLDELTYRQVYDILRRVPEAKADLFRITTDRCLIRLAETTKLDELEQVDDERLANKVNDQTLLYWQKFRGNLSGGF